MARCGVLASVGLVVVSVPACARSAEPVSARYMSLGDLQTSVSRRLADAGGKPESVRCDDGLVGEPGKTTECEVAFSSVTGVPSTSRVLVTSTGADQSNVTFDLAPAMSEQDVEKTVARMAGVPAARCQTGLAGKVGEATRCDLAPDAAAPVPDSGRIAEVAKVDPATLGMELAIWPILPKQQVQDMVVQRLLADRLPAQSVDCSGDVAAKAGSTVECVANPGPQAQRYDVTIVQTPDGLMNVDYTAKP